MSMAMNQVIPTDSSTQGAVVSAGNNVRTTITERMQNVSPCDLLEVDQLQGPADYKTREMEFQRAERSGAARGRLAKFEQDFRRFSEHVESLGEAPISVQDAEINVGLFNALNNYHRETKRLVDEALRQSFGLLPHDQLQAEQGYFHDKLHHNTPWIL